jgi:hypothetical protein
MRAMTHSSQRLPLVQIWWEGDQKLAKRLLLLLYIGSGMGQQSNPIECGRKPRIVLERLCPGADSVRGKAFMRLLVEYQSELRPPWPPAHVDNLRGKSKQFEWGDEFWSQIDACG